VQQPRFFACGEKAPENGSVVVVAERQAQMLDEGAFAPVQCRYVFATRPAQPAQVLFSPFARAPGRMRCAQRRNRVTSVAALSCSVSPVECRRRSPRVFPFSPPAGRGRRTTQKRSSR